MQITKQNFESQYGKKQTITLLSNRNHAISTASTLTKKQLILLTIKLQAVKLSLRQTLLVFSKRNQQ